MYPKLIAFSVLIKTMVSDCQYIFLGVKLDQTYF